MTALSQEGRRTLAAIAERHGVSLGACEHLLMAIMAGHGTQAQFNHPDLGGMGQWSQGGMIMVGDMFNTGLKARVSGLCSDIAALVQSMATDPAAGPFQTQSQSGSQSAAGSGNQGDGVSLFVPGSFSSGNWWPQGLGNPASTGAQNDLRYTFFPSSRRLAIDLAGRVTLYDTRDHQIGGFSQQQSGDQSLSFTSQYGLVRVSDLDVVSQPDPQTQTEPATRSTPAAEVAPSAAAAEAASGDAVRQQSQDERPAAAPSAPERAGVEHADIFDKLERLAALHARGILSDEEFGAKKKDLLDRI